jgi:hypothetical protein
MARPGHDDASSSGSSTRDPYETVPDSQPPRSHLLTSPVGRYPRYALRSTLERLEYERLQYHRYRHGISSGTTVASRNTASDEAASAMTSLSSGVGMPLPSMAGTGRTAMVAGAAVGASSSRRTATVAGAAAAGVPPPSVVAVGMTAMVAGAAGTAPSAAVALGTTPALDDFAINAMATANGSLQQPPSRCQPTNTQQSTRTRGGTKNYSNDELMSLLHCIQQVLPLGNDSWQLVADLHAIQYAHCDRTALSIKKKYI